MGIKDLLKGIRERNPAVFHRISLSQFRGHTVAIDVSIYGYIYMAVSNKEACKYIDILREEPSRSNLRSYWLERYFNFAMMFLENGITPIMVFDGKPFARKKKTKEKREEDKVERSKTIGELREQIEHTYNEQLFLKLRSAMENQIFHEKDDWDVLETMFRTMGLPVVRGSGADYEAEAICARLLHSGYASAVVTEDSDALAHLSKIVIMDINRDNSDRADHQCTCVFLDEVLETLRMTHLQFVDFCLMCGNDYIDRIRLIGFVKAMELIQIHKNIENALVALQKKKKDLHQYELSNLDIVREVRGYFLSKLDITLDNMPIVMYRDNLDNFFSEAFVGYNKTRMMSKLPFVTNLLREFNQNFATLQKFVLVVKEGIDE